MWKFFLVLLILFAISAYAVHRLLRFLNRLVERGEEIKERLREVGRGPGDPVSGGFGGDFPASRREKDISDRVRVIEESDGNSDDGR